jgi:hypothetical protein
LAENFLRLLGQTASSAELISALNLPEVDDQGHSFSYSSTLFGRIGTEPAVTASTTFSTPSSNPGDLSLSYINTALNSVTLPNYDITSPVVSLPTRPELVTPDAPDAPVLDEITLPASPTLQLPTAPTLAAVAFPDAPTLSLPTFAEAAPNVPDSFVQTSQFEWSEEGMDTPLLDAINGKLLTDVNDGGYGIESEDETALWSRARDRENIQLTSVEDSVREQYGNLGYSLPPGAMINALTRVRAEAEGRLSEQEREIVIKRADLFRDNRQFSMTQGTTVQNIELQHYGFRLERALNAQRFAAEYAINVHDAYVRQFNTELQRYTAIAEVYRTELQGALTQIQIYEAEVRAAVARQEANQVDVALYQALLQAATTRVNLFEAQLRSASVIADIQRLKVESYRSEVSAFATRIDANTAQLNAFRTEIEGEQAKVDIFRAEVGAYSDRVRAAAVEQTIASDRVSVALQTRDSELKAYQSRVEKYQTDVSIEDARIKSILSRYNIDASVYATAMAGYDSLTRLDLMRDNHELAVIQENTRRLQENSRLTLQAATQELETRFNASNAGATLSGAMLKAINTTFQGIALESTAT